MMDYDCSLLSLKMEVKREDKHMLKVHYATIATICKNGLCYGFSMWDRGFT